jgi:hypothetical protein
MALPTRSGCTQCFVGVLVEFVSRLVRKRQVCFEGKRQITTSFFVRDLNGGDDHQE